MQQIFHSCPSVDTHFRMHILCDGRSHTSMCYLYKGGFWLWYSLPGDHNLDILLYYNGKGPDQDVHFFYVHSHLRAPQKWARNYSSQFFKNRLVHNLLFELCTGIMIFYIYGKNCVLVLCLYFFEFFQKFHFPFLHLKRAHKYLWDIDILLRVV